MTQAASAIKRLSCVAGFDARLFPPPLWRGRARAFLPIVAVVLCLAAPAALANAAATNESAPAPAESPAPAPPSAEQLSLQGFGAQAASCLEWGDSCSICQRDEAGAMKCSTPGIACQPEAIVCRREKAK